MKYKKFISIPLILITCFLFLGSDGCESEQQQSLSGAEQVKSIFTVPKNSKDHTVEQQNIWDRLKVTTDPTKVLWIHLIALDGKIIRRMPVRCKVTSSGKRLEPTHAAPTGSGTFPDISGTYYETDEFLQADGTYGHSDPYIFWFDPMGRYHQYGTAGGIGYLVTDYPIDLRDPIDQITGLYKMNQAAYEWQQAEEKKLKIQEGKEAG